MSGFHNILDFSDNRVELVKHMSTKVGTLRELKHYFYIFLCYRGFSPNANFITANLVTAVFQNFLDIFCYCDFISILLMRFFC